MQKIEKNINKLVKLCVINISTLSSSLRSNIDKHILEIYSKGIHNDVSLVKKRIIGFLDKKRNSDLELGAISEFFIHLCLNMDGYSQECLYKNLEEPSMKKGFDGYYSKDKEEWIMESKSGRITTQGISHSKKINAAFNDLSNKVSGKVKNDPWENALYHANVAKTNDDIVKNIEKMSDDFVKGFFAKISDFNIIPASTIFLDGKDSHAIIQDNKKIKKEIENWVKQKSYKRMYIICVTQETKDVFWKYLES